MSLMTFRRAIVAYEEYPIGMNVTFNRLANLIVAIRYLVWFCLIDEVSTVLVLPLLPTITGRVQN
jgi:hypothetical protein